MGWRSPREKLARPFNFNGSNSVVQIPNTAGLNFGPTAPITVELWACTAPARKRHVDHGQAGRRLQQFLQLPDGL